MKITKLPVFFFSLCDFMVQLDVKEAKVVEDHPQWDISEDEEDKDKDNDEETEDDSDYSSEGDGSE